MDKNVWEALLRCRDDGRSPSGCYYWARDDLSGAYPSMLRDIILLIVGAGCIVPLSLFPCFFFCCCASRKVRTGAL